MELPAPQRTGDLGPARPLAARNALLDQPPPDPDEQAAWQEEHDRHFPVQKAGSGLMVALFLDGAAERLALPGGEDPRDLHITLAYLGKNASDAAVRRLNRAVARVAGRHEQLLGSVQGTGRFTPEEGPDAFYASPDVPGLSSLRAALVEELEADGLEPSSKHEFTPHVTLAYLDKGAPTPEMKLGGSPLWFGSLVVAHGAERTAHPLRRQDRVDRLADATKAADEAVSKALSVSEVAQVARCEVRMRRLMLAKWRAAARRAVEAGATAARASGSVAVVAAAAERVMRSWGREVVPRVTSDLRLAYRLSRAAGWRKASGRTRATLTYDVPKPDESSVEKAARDVAVRPSFDVVDQDAMDALEDNITHWIGEHYDDDVSEALRGAVKEAMVEGGGDRGAGADAVREALEDVLENVETPGGWRGSVESYFEMLAANAVTVARAHGTVRSFKELGIKRVVWSNPQDERTCDECSEMDGKEFKIEDVADQVEREVNARSPEAFKAAHPWHDPDGREVPVPPKHGRCRCVLDVTKEAVSEAALEDGEAEEKRMAKRAMKRGLEDLPALSKMDADFHSLEPSWHTETEPEDRGYGGIVFSAGGRVLMRLPSGDNGTWTFAKGRVGRGDVGPAATALREVAEETGCNPEIVGLVPGHSGGDKHPAFWFVMRAPEALGGHDDETDVAEWVDPVTAWQRVRAGQEKKQRREDLGVFELSMMALAELTGGARDFLKSYGLERAGSPK